MLDEENSQRLQNFIINCKVSGNNNVNRELLESYKKFLNDDQSANSDSKQQSTQDLSSKMDSMNLKNMADENQAKHLF